MSSDNAIATQETPVEFKLDLSKGAKNEARQPTKFDHLCDNVNSCLVTHDNSLDELYSFKDELLKHSLPLQFHLQLTLLSSRVFRSYSDLKTLVKELTRLVQLYSVPWEERGTVLQSLRADYDSKQRQLSIAIKQLEMIAIKDEQMTHEKRLNHWMRLYAKVMSAKSSGRRWKFRIEPFRKKIAEGYNPYGSDSEESDEDEELTQHRPSPSESDEELKELASGKASELSQALSSRLGASVLRRVQFADFEETDQPSSSPEGGISLPVRPVVETADAICWTGEPEFDNYLLIILNRPQGLLKGKDICCGLTLGDQYFSSQVYKPNDDDQQTFHFSLSDDAAVYLPPLCKPHQTTDIFLTPKLNVAVFPRSIADEMAAHCSIPLHEISLHRDTTILVPPDSHDESENSTEKEQVKRPIKWQPNWEELTMNLLSSDPDPVVYPLKLMEGQDEAKEDDSEEIPPHLLIVCQWIKVHRHKLFHRSISTQPWDNLMQEMGYKRSSETQSRAVSALTLESSRPTSPDKPMTPEVTPEEEEKMSAQEVAQLTLKHAEDLKLLQDQYEKKIEALSRTLSKFKSEKQKQIEELEQALMQSEANLGKRMKSPSELRQMMAQKRKIAKDTRGLPDWGKDWPENFFERMELFANDNLKRHAELTEKIKLEVKDTCERQLAALRRLAPTTTNAETAMDDISLPALFMPTNSSRPVIYNPRAHSYFHPPGSLNNRVSQPPTIFKLPPVQQSGVSLKKLTQLSTVNLYELGQNFSQTGPYWLRTDSAHPSPSMTPAPPPSACDYYLGVQKDCPSNSKPLK